MQNTTTNKIDARNLIHRAAQPKVLRVAVLLALLAMIGVAAYRMGGGPQGGGGGFGAANAQFVGQWSAQDLADSHSKIDVREILSGGPPKDGIPALTNPKVVPAAEADYLRPNDRVIGVEINGEARAYPLRILIWHENANDRLGGEPIAATYCPLCDSALVFHREIGGQVREFGISGKLWNSNVLLYDRQSDPDDESLWSQLRMEAVVGPAAEQDLKLKLIPSVLTTWRDWKKEHPDTTVLSIDTGHRRDYSGSPYGSYFANDSVGFGAHGSPERRPDLPNKAPIVVAEVNGEKRIYVVEDVARAAGVGGSVTDTLGGVELKITHLPEAKSLSIEPVGESADADVNYAYTFWFAWEEINPGVEIWAP